MCCALWEVIKCPGRVVCCCCKCACHVLLSFICSLVVLLVVIGLIVYFTVYYHPESDSTPVHEKLIQQTPPNFRDYVNTLN